MRAKFISWFRTAEQERLVAPWRAVALVMCAGFLVQLWWPQFPYGAIASTAGLLATGFNLMVEWRLRVPGSVDLPS